MADHAVLTARGMEDCLIDQDWSSYSAEDHAVWGTLFERQLGILRGRACEEYLDGLGVLGIDGSGVPDFARMNARLRRATGWEVVAVPG
jgi:phenylalanine-4-hydroxylase